MDHNIFFTGNNKEGLMIYKSADLHNISELIAMDGTAGMEEISQNWTAHLKRVMGCDSRDI
jgi:hypothetical protein